MTDNLDLYGTLKAYCEDNDIYFIPGEDDYVNAVNDADVYEAYDLLLVTDLTLSPNFADLDGSVTYNGTIGLGRKCEDETVSSLDETFQQKYDNRLKDLTSMLIDILNMLQCDEEGEILSCTINYEINSYDLNVDMVVANISIRFI